MREREREKEKWKKSHKLKVRNIFVFGVIYLRSLLDVSAYIVWEKIIQKIISFCTYNPKQKYKREEEAKIFQCKKAICLLFFERHYITWTQHKLKVLVFVFEETRRKRRRSRFVRNFAEFLENIAKPKCKQKEVCELFTYLNIFHRKSNK